MTYLVEEFGNAGSRTHEWGSRAKKAVQTARETMAGILRATPDEVVFTSGATESDNLAILGLAPFGRASGRTHILSSATEHKAVLEPLEHLSRQGFEVELLTPDQSGIFSVDEVLNRVRSDTLLVSLMLVNNETGVIQPVDQLAESLRSTPTYLHVDAAQGFGKPVAQDLGEVDLVSISGHKIGALKGVGALAVRRRGWDRIPLEPLMFGGGQERKLRPGTVPVPLVVGLALAAELLTQEAAVWDAGVREFRNAFLKALQDVPHEINGDPERSAPHILNVAFPGVDGEALILALKDIAAVATGSACTSASYTPSHVLMAMGLEEDRVLQSLRFSWWSDTDHAGIGELVDIIRSLQR
jgi:cysteine desulfurase